MTDDIRDDLDRRLSEYGARWRAAQPAPPEPVLNPFRRPWLPVLAAAAAVALVAAGVTLAVRAATSSSPATPTHPGVDLHGTIPWIDTPAPKPSRSLAGRPADAPPCSAAQVHVFNGSTNGATQHLFHYLAFRNVSTRTCLLKGTPRTVATGPGRAAVTADHHVDAQVPGTANLLPGSLARLLLETRTACPANPSGAARNDLYEQVTITLPSGGDTIAPRTKLRLNGCGLGVSHFWVADSAAAYSPIRQLRARLETPSTVTAGSRLVYVVDLTNPTSHAIALDPCPGYDEFVGYAKPIAPPRSSTYELNCAPVRSIDPGKTVRFEMRLHVPAFTTPDKYQVEWGLSGLSVFATAPIKVVAATTPPTLRVPWVDRPTTAPSAPPQPTPPPAAYAECTAGQLAVQPAKTGAAAGTLFTDIPIENRSGKPCSLTGYPATVEGLRTDGSSVKFHRGGQEPGAEWTANLLPKQHAHLVIAASDHCTAWQRDLRDPQRPGNKQSTEVHISLRGGGVLSSKSLVEGACGAYYSRFGTPQPLPQTRYNGLAVLSDPPRSAKAGSTLHYTITLSNTTQHDIALNPCPVFRQSLFLVGGEAVAGGQYYQLNCDRVTRIAAGQSVDYAMELRVPNDTGDAKFNWNIPYTDAVLGGEFTISP